jgi:uncharacterized DUF497 family protein
MRFHFDVRKSKRLRSKPKRGIGFEEAQEVFLQAYYLDQRSDLSEQYRAIGWVGERLYAVIFEIRKTKKESFTISSLMESNQQEQKLYEEHS